MLPNWQYDLIIMQWMIRITIRYDTRLTYSTHRTLTMMGTMKPSGYICYSACYNRCCEPFLSFPFHWQFVASVWVGTISTQPLHKIAYRSDRILDTVFLHSCAFHGLAECVLFDAFWVSTLRELIPLRTSLLQVIMLMFFSQWIIQLAWLPGRPSHLVTSSFKEYVPPYGFWPHLGRLSFMLLLAASALRPRVICTQSRHRSPSERSWKHHAWMSFWLDVSAEAPSHCALDLHMSLQCVSSSGSCSAVPLVLREQCSHRYWDPGSFFVW